jgi:transaldolase
MTVTSSPIARLVEYGQSPWYDNLTRQLITGGGLQRLVDDDGIRGVTSNPTIFEKAMAAGEGYDEQLTELAKNGAPIDSTYWALVLDDIRHAADVLRPSYDALDGTDGFVSVEVAPDRAHETAATIEQVHWLHDQAARPNVFVKIPATLAGVPAIEDCLAEGISINITLIFSLGRYAEVVEAYLRGLERHAEQGGDLSRVASVASFFVSRVDTEADRRLPEGHPLRGKVAVANAKLAYGLFRETFAGDRWDALAARGARLQRPLWASTSTKNPAYRDVLYVEELIGPDTVNTMPVETVHAFQDHGEIRGATLLEGVGAAKQLLADLADAGIDYDDVVETLEAEGVKKFADSFAELLDGVRAKRGELAHA